LSDIKTVTVEEAQPAARLVAGSKVVCVLQASVVRCWLAVVRGGRVRT